MSDTPAKDTPPPAKPKRPGFWRRVGQAAAEFIGQVIYQGPR